MQTNIDRFLEAQNNGRYEQALAEIKTDAKSRIGYGTFFRNFADWVIAVGRNITELNPGMKQKTI